MCDSEWTPRNSSNFPCSHNYYVCILYIIFIAGCSRHLQIHTSCEVTNSASCRKPKVTHQWCKCLGKHLSGKKMLAYVPKLRSHRRMVWVKYVWVTSKAGVSNTQDKKKCNFPETLIDSVYRETLMLNPQGGGSFSCTCVTIWKKLKSMVTQHMPFQGGKA